MSVTAATAPQYPVGKAKLTFALSGGGNFLRLWLTAAPVGSEHRERLEKSKAGRVEVFNGDADDTFTFSVTQGGKYVFAAQEYTKGASAHGGGYATDPDGFKTETPLPSGSPVEDTVSVVFGDRLTMPVGVGPDTATLVLFVFAATIRATAFDVQGETTPRLVEPSTPKARTAAADATVAAAVDALADQTATDVLGSMSSLTNGFRTAFNAHIDDGTVHPSADSDNTISAGFQDASTPEGLGRVLAEHIKLLKLHMTTDSGSGPGTGDYHTSSKADWANIPIVAGAGSTAQALSAFSDVWRAYEAHRVDTGVHSSADVTNTLAALPELLEVHRAFNAALQPTSPTAPATANEGTTVLVHGAGMTEG